MMLYFQIYNYIKMQLKTWVNLIRILNVSSSATLVSFQIWFIISLLIRESLFQIISRIFAPLFLLLFGILIITSEYKYKKVVQYFKFLQSLYGLGFFNFFLASILSFEFSTLNHTASIVSSTVFFIFGICFCVLSCLKPKDYSQYDSMGQNTK